MKPVMTTKIGSNCANCGRWCPSLTKLCTQCGAKPPHAEKPPPTAPEPPPKASSAAWFETWVE